MTKKKRKVGIITFHDTTNFGATLQAVATYKAVKELGADAEIIDYRCEQIDKRELPKSIRDLKKCSLKQYIIYCLTIKKEWKKYHALHTFLEKETTLSQRYNKNNIYLTDSRYDVFLVGSDMLWRMEYTNHDYTYMLDFLSSDKKNTYSTSMGYDWDEKDLPTIKKLLKEFNVLSVREKETANKLIQLLNREVYQVCDPTMLICSSEWNKYITHPVKREKYVFVYMDDEKKRCIRNAVLYAKQYGLKIHLSGIKLPNKINRNYKIVELYCIQDFLSEIANASILFTASYHGMLFSIYFHIPFVYYNKDLYRLEDIAKKLGLESRNGNKFHPLEMKPIDWAMIDKKKDEFSKYSRKVLKEIVTDEKTNL